MQTYGDWSSEPNAFETSKENEYGENVNDIAKGYEEK